jgi:hypothetical protein
VLCQYNLNSKSLLNCSYNAGVPSPNQWSHYNSTNPGIYMTNVIRWTKTTVTYGLLHIFSCEYITGSAPWVRIKVRFCWWIIMSLAVLSVLNWVFTVCQDDFVLLSWAWPWMHSLKRWVKLSPISCLSWLSLFHRDLFFLSFGIVSGFRLIRLNGVARALSVKLCSLEANEGIYNYQKLFSLE